MTPPSTIIGSAIRRSVPLGGGAARVELADGRVVVVKEGPGVAAEAAGLRWLAVPGGPPLPEVLSLTEAGLVTGYVPPGRPSAAAAAALGTRLAALHASGPPAFGAGPPGAPTDAWIGRAPMRNVAGGDWAPWYAEHRVAPYLRTARETGDLTADEAAVIERVCERLAFLGRLDHQVKVRGFRIELREIETALLAHPAVAEAVVVASADGAAAGAGLRLAAYVVAGPGQTAPTAAELRGWLRRSLPEHMVPGAFVPLPALPLTPSGKLDRGALPAPTSDHLLPAGPLTPPRTELERTLAALWQDVLGLPNVGRDDNFFDLGGHSLLLIRLQGQLRAALGREVPVADLFRFTTVRALAEHLEPGLEPAAVPQSRVAAATGPAPAAADDHRIAIVALAGRFPGAHNVDELWRNLRAGVESVTFWSDEELLAAGVSPELLRHPSYVRASASLDGYDLFDAGFFGMSPREVQALDPQHRLFLESAWEAIELAGYDAGRYPGAIGVFAGMGMNGYLLHEVSRDGALVAALGSFQTMLGNDKDFLPTRVSYKLNLRGPSILVQTACSTSLVAVHLACRSLLAGECDMALAGGVTIAVPHRHGYLYQDGGIFSPDGHCRAFDAAAKGTVPASGVGIVVLKRLADAVADGDTIHAVIRASAINNDGSRKIGYTAPSITGQVAVLRQALAAAQVDAESISYIETHGTGTLLGDLVEVTALKEAYGALTDKRGFCAIGSLKTNFGHLDTAAGVGGLIKTVLALRHRELPPSLHFERANPRLHLDGSPFFVNTRLSPWAANGTPRRAGVSSFGIGGTNVHVIVEEAPERPAAVDPGPQLILLSARTASALDRAARNLADHLDSHPELPLAAVAATLQLGRRCFAERRMVVAADRADLVRDLRETTPGRVASSSLGTAAERPVVFLFPGGGAQYAGMTRDVYAREPLFREQVDACAALLVPHLGLDLREVLYPAPERAQEATQRLRRTALGLPALFTVEYALAQLWMSLGVRPQALIGHSLGEYVAACLAGILSLPDALALVALRGRLFETLPQGAMLGVPLAEGALRSRLGEELSIAALNLPDHCVVSGRTEAVHALEAELTAEGIDCRRIQIEVAAHSAIVEPILDEFGRFAAGLSLDTPRIPMVSNLTGTWITARDAADPQYWRRHLRQTVRFADGVRELLKQPERVLLEVGPGRTLATLARRHPQRAPEQVVLTSLRHPEDQEGDVETLLAAAGQLWLAGCELDWQAFQSDRPVRRVPLPPYPFERERFWANGAAAAAGAAARIEAPRGPADWLYTPRWERVPLPPAAAAAEGTWLLFGGTSRLDRALAQELAGRGADVVVVSPGEEAAWSGAGELSLRPQEPADYHWLLDALEKADRRPARIVHAWCVAPAVGDGAGDADFGRWQALGFESLLHLDDALAAARRDDATPIELLTSETQEVLGGEPLAPAKAMVLGWCEEVPGARGSGRAVRAVDVLPPPAESAEERRLAGQLANDLTRLAREPFTAYRAGRRWVRALKRVPAEAAPAAAPREDGPYLVADGGDGLGVALAAALAQRPGARIAWAPPPGADLEESRRELARRLDGAPGEVEVLSVGTDGRERDAALLEEARRRLGTLYGVVATSTAPLGERTWDAELRRARALTARHGTRIATLPPELELRLAVRPLVAAFHPAGSRADRAAAHLAHAEAAAGGAAATSWRELVWDEAASGVEAEEALRRVLALREEPWVVVSTRDLAARVASWSAERDETSGAAAPTPAAAPPDARLHRRPQLAVPFAAPRTDLERTLARIWEEVLGVAPVGIHDHFHALGGDSVLAIQAVAKAQQHGIPLTQRKAYLNPTIADLSIAVGIDSSISAKQGVLTGRVSLTPIQRWFFDEVLPPDPHHWNLDVLLETREDVEPRLLAAVLEQLVLQHDALRLRYAHGAPGWQQWYAEPDGKPFFRQIDLSALPEERHGEAIAAAGGRLQESLDLAAGPLVRAAFFHRGAGRTGRLLLVFHHLAFDAVSLRIVLEDVESWYEQLRTTGGIARPQKTTSFDHWALRITELGRSRAADDELEYWLAPERKSVARLPIDFPEGANTMGSIERVTLALGTEETRTLLQDAPKAFDVDVQVVLLTALARACERWTGERALLVDMEGHGREPIFEEVDLSRTVGWFTSVYPLLLDLRGAPPEARSELLRVREQIRGVPNRGIGYGLLRHLNQSAETRERIRAMPPAEIVFLYLSQTQRPSSETSCFRMVSEPRGNPVSPRGIKRHLLDLGARVFEGRLHLSFSYSSNLYRRATVEGIAETYRSALASLLGDAARGAGTAAGQEDGAHGDE